MKTQFANQLKKLHACSNAVEWVGKRDFTTAWKECERADWMLWLCGRMVGKPGWPTRQEVVFAACDCAETAKQWWPKGDTCEKAIKTARQWARGEVKIQEVIDAADATDATAAAGPAAVEAAARLADASDYYITDYYAANAGSDAAGYAANAAADACVYAAATNATDADAATRLAADANAARKKAHIRMCDLIRKRLIPSHTGDDA